MGTVLTGASCTILRILGSVGTSSLLQPNEHGQAMHTTYGTGRIRRLRRSVNAFYGHFRDRGNDSTKTFSQLIPWGTFLCRLCSGSLGRL